MQNNKMYKKKRKKKIKYKNLIIIGIILFLIIFIIISISNIKLKNIYVKGNSFLTDQQIIDIAGLKEYPKITKLKKKKIIKRLKENKYIKDVKIKFNNFKQEINIEIIENKPVIFYQYDESYLLSDGSSVSDINYSLPVLINQTPDLILKKLLKKLESLDENVLYRISEIRYYPSKVDEELFYLTMNDGNYIYINFNSFEKLNNYIDIIKGFDNKKGILHLDSGDYLDVFK